MLVSLNEAGRLLVDAPGRTTPLAPRLALRLAKAGLLGQVEAGPRTLLVRSENVESLAGYETSLGPHPAVLALRAEGRQRWEPPFDQTPYRDVPLDPATDEWARLGAATARSLGVADDPRDSDPRPYEGWAEDESDPIVQMNGVRGWWEWPWSRSPESYEGETAAITVAGFSVAVWTVARAHRFAYRQVGDRKLTVPLKPDEPPADGEKLWVIFDFTPALDEVVEALVRRWLPTEQGRGTLRWLPADRWVVGDGGAQVVEDIGTHLDDVAGLIAVLIAAGRDPEQLATELGISPAVLDALRQRS